MDEIENEPHIAGLQFLGCSKRYGATQALSQVTFGVMPGSVVALVGANGAGKTTLLHALVGLVSLDTGDIQLDGVPSRSVAAKRRIAFMPDDLPRPVRLTARELVELTMRLYGCSDVDIDELGARMDLTGRLDQLLASYSHGMRRKVDLMAALAVSPDVLVLDEPFSGLDPGMVAQLAAILEDYAQRRKIGARVIARPGTGAVHSRSHRAHRLRPSGLSRPVRRVAQAAIVIDFAGRVPRPDHPMTSKSTTDEVRNRL